MKRNNQITILGSGTSTGIPMVGCNCAVCNSQDSRNKRLRTSIYIETTLGKKILVDTTPDLRAQLLTHDISQVDAAIITHDHADHVHGIDDLRPLCFSQHKAIPLFVLEDTALSLTQKFSYIFKRTKPVIGGGIPRLEFHPLKINKINTILEEPFYITTLPHGYTRSLSFMHSKFAYIIDCHDIPIPYIELLRSQKLELLIIDCVKKTSHDTHLNFSRALEFIELIKPKQAGLIHMGHELEHQAMIDELSELGHDHIFPVFDGQILNYS